jgi:hypothetical protein
MLEKAAKDALLQIEEKRYTDAFKNREVLGIAMAFCGKEMRYAYQAQTSVVNR